MRRVRYSVAMSLDGYISGPNGEADWIVTDPDPDDDFGAYFNQFDTFLLGRRTFEPMAKVAGKTTMPGMKTFVFSRTLRQADYPAVTIVADKTEETVAGLRAEGKGHLVVRRRGTLSQPPRREVGGHGGGCCHAGPPRRGDSFATTPVRADEVKVDRPQGLQDGDRVSGIRGGEKTTLQEEVEKLISPHSCLTSRPILLPCNEIESQ
jgi:hypothetical protein